MLRLTFKSLLNRRTITLLTILSISISVILFSGIDKLRQGARESFKGTVSGTNLIVGARSGQIPLLLFSLFHIGAPTSNVTYASFLKYAKHPAVEWAIPLSIGDSHKGFRVVGTTSALTNHYRFHNQQRLTFTAGKFSFERFKVALGSTVAENLHYKLGSKLVLTHGISDAAGIHDHDENPFEVAAIFAPTGTPFDKGIYISLESLELMHEEDHDEDHEHDAHKEHKAKSHTKHKVHIDKLTSFLLRVKEPTDVPAMMRTINEDASEPLTAIIPGITLGEIWNLMNYAEGTLKLVALMVTIAAILGLFISLFSTLSERRREMAILRSLGASPRVIASQFCIEGLLLTAGGIMVGYISLLVSSIVFQKTLLKIFAVRISVFSFGQQEILFCAALLISSLLISLIPAWMLYRSALHEGLQVRN